MQLLQNVTQYKGKILFGALAALIFCSLVWAVYRFFPGGHDWINYFYPTAWAVLSGKSLYLNNQFFNPPWTILPLLPFAFLPPKLGFAIFFWLGLITAGYASYRFGAKPLAIAAVLLSYPILANSAYGNIEWLVFLGYVLPPRWGLFLVLIKPQSSIGIVVYWFVEAYRQGGVKKVFTTFAPVSLCLLLSFVFFGPWYNAGLNAMRAENLSASLWPQSIPIGLVLLLHGIRTRNIGVALMASPFLSPFLSSHTWGVAIIGLSSMQWETVVASLGVWIVRLLTNKFLN